MKSASSGLPLGFIYDFSMTGGKIGTQNTGIQFPNKAGVFGSTMYIDIAFAGGATISIGTSISPSLFGGPVVFATARGFYSGIMGGFPSAIMDNTLNVIITIAGAAVTAGRVQFNYYFFPYQ
jgi:hypothetical protein